MLLSFVLTMLPVTHARLLDADEAAIALAEGTTTTSQHLLEEDPPGYGRPIAEMLGGTALVVLGLGATYFGGSAAIYGVVVLTLVFGLPGLMLGIIGFVLVEGLCVGIAVGGGALAVRGIRDAAAVHDERAQIARQLSDVRDQAPQPVTVVRF